MIAHGTCVRVPDEPQNAPTYDEFLANGARRLKHDIDLAARSRDPVGV